MCVQKAVELLELECALCLHQGCKMHVVTGHMSVSDKSTSCA